MTFKYTMARNQHLGQGVGDGVETEEVGVNMRKNKMRFEQKLENKKLSFECQLPVGT